MKLPIFRRIYKGDYPQEQQPLVEQLATTINNGLEILYELANNKVSLRDNIYGVVKDIEVQVNAAGTPLSSVTVPLPGVGRPDGMMVLKVDNLTNSAIYSDPVITHFSPITNGVQIVNIQGLNPAYKYRIRVVVFQN